MGREITFLLKVSLPNTVKGSLSTYHVHTFLRRSLTKINMEALKILDNVFPFSKIGKIYSSKKNHLYLNNYSAIVLIDQDYVFFHTIKGKKILKGVELTLFRLKFFLSFPP